MTFRLSDSFIAKYAEVIPNWGPLGEFVYLRTYSRYLEDEKRNEKWFETVRRVVEGTYSIQQEHCVQFHLPWNSTKAHRSAEKMYDKIFTFKFLPPGRGLWMMGTSFVKDKGSAALNNCGYISSSDIATRGSFIFTWTMDALMLGVGVGFDTKGAGKVTIHSPKEPVPYAVPDSREGWVDSLRVLIDAYFKGNNLPVFDYSFVRPYGAPIKGFGGTASGPDPLRKMHESIKGLLDERIGATLSSTDIVDIVNMISVCVVAGNVRRSACIAIGEVEDKAYVTMKDSTLHADKLMSHRWASNNSVFAEVGHTDYSSFVDSIALNGEPGIVWLENVQKYSRTAGAPDWKDRKAVGVNPCTPYETPLLTSKGYRHIGECAGSNVEVWNGNEFSKVFVKKTGENQKLMEVFLSNGTSLRCTPYHTWVLQGGKRVQASELDIGDILERFSMPIIPGEIELPNAYESGIFAGDGQGTGCKAGVLLYGEKKALVKHLCADVHVGSYDEMRDRLYVGMSKLTLLPKTSVPDAQYTIQSRLKWLAGLIDTDGTITKDKNSASIQITSVNKRFMDSLRLMLTTLGVQANMSVMHTAGFRKMPDGKGGSKEYLCQEAYRLTFGNRAILHLRELGLCTHRIDLSKATDKARDCSRFVRVIGIKDAGTVDAVYCFNEPLNHTGTFNGIVTGQCAEQALENCELCCLVETFPSLHETYAEYNETLKYAYLYAKTVTLLATHWPETNAVLLKNRRIGLSQSGIQGAFVKHGRRQMLEWCDAGYGYIQALDELYSDWLCVPRSKKTTSVKPSGSVSLLPGVSAGIHYPHAEYYIRRVRVSAQSPLVLIMRTVGYEIEDDHYGDVNTKVINFPVCEKFFSKRKEDVSIWEQVKDVVDYQRWWADNNVSVTVTFKPKEKAEIVSVLEAYEDSLKTISFLPLTEHGYVQAPYEQITKERWEQMSKGISRPCFDIMTSTPIGSKFCDGEHCSIE